MQEGAARQMDHKPPTPAAWAGFLFLAIVLDACSRKVVGWSMENHLKTELVLAAINMALAQRRPEDGVIHQGDKITVAEQARLLAVFAEKIPSLYPADAKGGFFSQAKDDI